MLTLNEVFISVRWMAAFLSIWFTLFFAGLTYQQSACENCISDIYGNSYVFVTVYYYAKNLIWWPAKEKQLWKNWNRKLSVEKCAGIEQISVWTAKNWEWKWARRDATAQEIKWIGVYETLAHKHTDHATISIIGKNLFKYLNGLHSLLALSYFLWNAKNNTISSEVFFDHFIFLAYAFLQWLVWIYRTRRDGANSERFGWKTEESVEKLAKTNQLQFVVGGGVVVSPKSDKLKKSP